MRYTLLILIVVGLLSCKGRSKHEPVTLEFENVDTTTKAEEPVIPDADRLPIELKTWELDSYVYNGNEIPGYNFDRPISLKLDHNKLNGYGGCNGYSGALKLGEGKTIAISEIVSTKVACPSRMVHEKRLFELLEAAETYKDNLAWLTIESGALGSLKFRLKPEKKTQ